MITRILVGYDGTDQALDALSFANALRHLLDGTLIVAAVDEAGGPAYGNRREWQASRERYFEAMFASASRALDADEYERRTSIGSVPAALDFIADTEAVDLIVVGRTHRAGLGSGMPIGVGGRLLHGAPCAVAVAPSGYREQQRPPVRRIGLGYDDQRESHAALAQAVELARRLGAELILITVVPPVEDSLKQRFGAGAEEYRVAVQGRFEEQLAAGVDEIPDDVRSDSMLVHGDPATTLADRGGELDLLVLGSRGYGPLRRVMLGGVAHRVVELAACPVIVLPRSATRAE